jgi:hypothetical protein
VSTRTVSQPHTEHESQVGPLDPVRAAHSRVSKMGTTRTCRGTKLDSTLTVKNPPRVSCACTSMNTGPRSSSLEATSPSSPGSGNCGVLTVNWFEKTGVPVRVRRTRTLMA